MFLLHYNVLYCVSVTEQTTVKCYVAYICFFQKKQKINYTTNISIPPQMLGS